jgi:hypothetical protein
MEKNYNKQISESKKATEDTLAELNKQIQTLKIANKDETKKLAE